MTVPDDALFQPDGANVVPTEFARGPWTPDALHGGPVAALLARAVESIPTDEPMHVTRLTVELLRPVPLAPLSVSASVVRPGRKVQLVDARISSGDREVAWARALRIRLQPRDPDAPDVGDAGAVPGVDAGAPPGPETGYDIFAAHRPLSGLSQRRGGAAVRRGAIRRARARDGLGAAGRARGARRGAHARCSGPPPPRTSATE